MTAQRRPDVAVVVPSHGRTARLGRLLDSLARQTLAPERFEVVVVHDYDERETRDTLDAHPLADRGVLRHIAIAPGTGQPARQRNIGWRATRAPLVAFVDDDCRAAPGWLEAYLGAAERAAGAVVQGVTTPDPDDAEAWGAPHVRTMHVPDPPNLFLQTCNILYPREMLERLGGFDESLTSGEDTDLGLRAVAAGARVVGEAGAVVHHAVEAYSLAGYIRMSWKWRDLVLLVRRHPELRQRAGFRLGIFWKDAHWQLLAGLAGIALARRIPPLALLAAPYLNAKLRRRGRGQMAKAALELPGQAAADAGEIAAMVAGSIEHRTLML